MIPARFGSDTVLSRMSPPILKGIQKKYIFRCSGLPAQLERLGLFT